MYTSSMKAVAPKSTAKGDKVYEYDLTTAYNISTATLRTSYRCRFISRTRTFSTLVMHGAMQVVFNNDGTKMFIADHNKTIIEWTLTTPYDIDTASTTFDLGQSFDTGLVKKKDRPQLRLIMMELKCMLLEMAKIMMSILVK